MNEQPAEPTQPEQESSRVDVDDLAALEPGWDSYGAKPPTDAAIATARHTQIIPVPDGGLQMEWHINGFDAEIEINAEGRVVSFYCEPASSEADDREPDDPA